MTDSRNPMKGSWPGGPSRSGEAEPLGRKPRLDSAESIDARAADRAQRHKHRRSARRKAILLAASMVAAGGVGWLMGVQSKQSPESIRLSQERERRAESDRFISSEVNRTLLQLWRMEDIEAARNSGRAR